MLDPDISRRIYCSKTNYHIIFTKGVKKVVEGYIVLTSTLDIFHVVEY
jgi:hypothetical protein